MLFPAGLTVTGLLLATLAERVLVLRFPSFQSTEEFEVFLVFGATRRHLHFDQVAPMMTKRTLCSFNN